MATPTYTLIDSTVLGTASSSVTFSSIPATYRDLVLVCDVASAAGGGFGYVQFNGDTGGNYNYVRMLGDGSSTYSASGASGSANAQIGYVRSTAKGVRIVQIMDYSATDKHKSMLVRSNEQDVGAWANRWASTSAITSVSVYVSGQSFAAGSTFYLYGIEA